MNILLASTNYVEPGKSAAGLPNYLRRIGKILTDEGHNVTIVYSKNYNQHRYDGNIEVYSVRVPRITLSNKANEFKVNGLIKGYYINKKVEEINRNCKIDIIQFASIEGIGMFYKGDVPAVIRLSSYAKIAYANDCGTLPPDFIEELTNMEVNAAKHIGNVYGPSKLTAEYFEKDYGRKVDVVESPFFSENNLDESIYQTCLKDKKYVLYFGKMYAEKGVVEISEMLERFLDSNPLLYFVMIGENTVINNEGAYSILKKSAGIHKERLLLFEEMEHKKLFSIVQHAECAVLPSYMENFSNACLEAMYYNGLVVATKDAGYEQLIQDGYSGFLCNVRDSKDLFNVVNKTIHLEEEEKSLIRKRAKERVLFNRPERIVRQLLAYYNRIIEKNTTISKKDALDVQNEVDIIYKNNRDKVREKEIVELDKSFLNNRVLTMWLKKKVAGNDPVERFLCACKEKKIAVYGMSDIGKMVVDSAEEEGISITCIIDQNLNVSYKKYVSYTLEEFLREDRSIDVIIVTPIYYYEEIKKSMGEKNSDKIFSIENIVFSDVVRDS